MWSNLSSAVIDPRDAKLYGADVYSIVNPDVLMELSKETKEKIKKYRIENTVKKENVPPPEEFLTLTHTVKKSFICFCKGGQIPINKVIGVDKHYRNLINKINNFNSNPNDLPVPRPRFTSFLNVELFSLLEHLAPTDAEAKAKIYVFNQIKFISKSLFPNSNLTIFGSSITGTCLPGSDLNLMLEANGDPILNLKLLAYFLAQFDLLQCFECILQTRIPIIKGVHKIKGSIVTISANSSLDTHDFIAKKMDEFKYIKPLVILLKFFLQSRNLGDTYTGGIGSYLLCLMIIFFLQMHISTTSNTLNTTLADLFIDFFHFWAYRFNYESMTVSVTGAGASKKNKRDNNLFLQDPIDPNIDVGKPAFNFSLVIKSFQSAFKILKTSENDYTRSIKDEYSPLGPNWIKGNTIIEKIFDPQHPFFQHRKVEKMNNPVLERYKIFNDKKNVQEGMDDARNSLHLIIDGSDAAFDLNHVPYSVATLRFAQTFDN